MPRSTDPVDAKDVQALIQDLLSGSEPASGEEREEYQVAGDVVPLRPGMDLRDERFLSRLNQEPLSGAMGRQSIQALGGGPRYSPYLDLMDILMFNRRPR